MTINNNFHNNSFLFDEFFLSSMLQQLPGFIMLMDTESRFIYSNQYTANLLGYKNVDQLLGDNAYDIHCDAAVCAPDFLKQDAYVRENLTTLTMLEIHNYANDQQKILLAKKSPFFLDYELVGSINHASFIESACFQKISGALLNSDKKYFQRTVGRSYIINQTISNDDLTKRELDCLFYLLRGKTLKSIAKLLKISWRTVESYLNRIKIKWGCSNKSQLIEYALLNGYFNYIPKEIFSEEISKVLFVGDI